MTNNPSPASVTDFISRALDGGYVQATASLYEAIERDYRSGALPDTLRNLERRARELEANNDTFSANDPYIRAVRADFEAYITRLQKRLDVALDEVLGDDVDAAMFFRWLEDCGLIDEWQAAIEAELPDELNEVMTAGEVVEMYNLSESAVRQAINRGMPARKSGGTWLLRREDVQARWGKK